MSFYGIKDNKCRIDLTERTPEIATIEDLGYTSNTSLLTILDNYRNKNCLLIYSVSNVSSTKVYPITVPEDDSAIVIINKVGNHASIEFHFYNSFYTAQYLFGSQGGPRLSNWMQISKAAIVKGSLDIPYPLAPQATMQMHKDLSAYNIPSDASIVVTQTHSSDGAFQVMDIDIVPLLSSNNKVYFYVKNKSSRVTYKSITFNWCII